MYVLMHMAPMSFTKGMRDKMLVVSRCGRHAKMPMETGSYGAKAKTNGLYVNYE
jgi:hypothetical protein